VHALGADEQAGLDLNCRFGVIGSQNDSIASRVRGVDNAAFGACMDASLVLANA
jgi:hypothetical protein